MSKDKIHEFPLHVFGDQLTAALEQAGIKGAVFIAAANTETGLAATTSNLDMPDQIGLLGHVRNSMIDGTNIEGTVHDMDKDRRVQ